MVAFWGAWGGAEVDFCWSAPVPQPARNVQNRKLYAIVCIFRGKKSFFIRAPCPSEPVLKLANASTWILGALEFPLANHTGSAQFKCPRGESPQRGLGNGTGFDLAATCKR